MSLIKLARTFYGYLPFHQLPKQTKWWQQLNSAQKFSVTLLYRFDYKMCFIRRQGESYRVILSRKDGYLCIEPSGKINAQAHLQVRNIVIK